MPRTSGWWSDRLPPRLVAPSHSSERLLTAVGRILERNTLCSMATRSAAGVLNVNAAFFACGPSLQLYFLSNPSSAHCRNLTHVAEMAVLVFDSRQEWGMPHAGLQLYGTGGPVTVGESERARSAYAARFARYFDLAMRAGEESEGMSGLAALRFYRFMPARVKILDEEEFGDEVYIVADLVA